MFKLKQWSLLVMLFSGYGTVQAQAWDEKFYNPKAASDDVVLPMPCEGSMVFRVIKSGTKKPLEDSAVILGSESATDGFAEHATPNYIGGSFSSANGERYYLMAKYEVNQLQYQSVMNETCPKANLKMRLPVTKISWFEAMNFTDKYNQWILKNKAALVPSEDNSKGFLRLPTNAEWEYAARGGNAVSESEFRESSFPMPKGMASYAWFASSKSANGRLQLTGLLEPNPLGLYDMLGNAGEMMFDAFRMNKLDRYHGQSGGVTIRGGSYLVPEESINSSLRIERPFYSSAGQADSAVDIGFRLVVSAPLITSSNRIKELEKEWQALGKDDKSTDTHGGGTNIVNQLEQITQNVENEKTKKELQTLNDALRAANQARDEQRDHAIRSTLQLGAFLCTDVADLNERYQGLNDLVESVKPLCEDGSTEGLCAKEQRDRQEASLKEAKDVRDFVLKYYADTLVSTNSAYSLNTIQAQVEAVKSKLISSNKANLADYINLYWQHLSQYNRDGKINRDQWLTACSSVRK